MKTVIKSTLMLAMAFCVFSLHAQQPQRGQRANSNPEERAKAQTELMTKEVGLNEGQAKKVNELYLERHKQIAQSNAQRQRPAQGQARQKGPMLGQDTTFNRKLSNILTKEQALKWSEAQERMRSERQKASSDNRGQNRGGGGRQGQR